MDKIPPGSLELMYDLQLKEFVEILTLLGSSSTEISSELSSLPYVKPFTKEEIEGYLYFFWNMNPDDGWTADKRLQLRTFLSRSSTLAHMYRKHLRLGFGQLPRIRIAVELGIDCPKDVILKEFFRGFCQGVLQKNDAMFNDDIDIAESLSKILLRDTQVLRGLGYTPSTKGFLDDVEVFQEIPPGTSV
jgi:hypothetical protein